MDIDSLFQDARTGHRESEDQLFRALRDSFRLFVQLRFRNADDCEDIVQNALVFNPMAAALNVLEIPEFTQYDLVKPNRLYMGIMSTLLMLVLVIQVWRLKQPQ